MVAGEGLALQTVWDWDPGSRKPPESWAGATSPARAGLAQDSPASRTVLCGEGSGWEERSVLEALEGLPAGNAWWMGVCVQAARGEREEAASPWLGGLSPACASRVCRGFRV